MHLLYFNSAQDWLLMMPLLLLPTLFWIAMLVDVIRRPFANSNDKLIWVLVIVLTHFAGALVYFFVGRKQVSG